LAIKVLGKQGLFSGFGKVEIPCLISTQAPQTCTTQTTQTSRRVVSRLAAPLEELLALRSPVAVQASGT
jgi:hypothetical protein